MVYVAHASVLVILIGAPGRIAFRVQRLHGTQRGRCLRPGDPPRAAASLLCSLFRCGATSSKSPTTIRVCHRNSVPTSPSSRRRGREGTQGIHSRKRSPDLRGSHLLPGHLRLGHSPGRYRSPGQGLGENVLSHAALQRTCRHSRDPLFTQGRHVSAGSDARWSGPGRRPLQGWRRRQGIVGAGAAGRHSMETEC